MIVANLNALREWQRVRESTEPEIPDVDRNPGTEDADAASLEEGSHGRVRRAVRRRRRREEPDRQGSGQWYHPHGRGRSFPRAGHMLGREGDEIDVGYEDELEELDSHEPHERGLIAEYQGQNVDLDG